MSTQTLLRSTAHPPCPQEQEILEIAVPADRTELALTDRLSLRLGLWLMLRTQRQRRNRNTTMSRDEALRLLSARRNAGTISSGCSTPVPTTTSRASPS